MYYTNWTRAIINTLQDRTKLIISDVDDTLLDSSMVWYQKCLELLPSIVPAPTYEEFARLGPRHFYSQITDTYDSLKQHLMQDAQFNSGMPLLPSANILRNQKILSGYISTRPMSLHTVTTNNLQQHSLSSAPLLLRPSFIPYEDTIDFKINAIQALRAALDADVYQDVSIFYVDDYKNATKRINLASFKYTKAIHFHEKYDWQYILRDIGI